MDYKPDHPAVQDLAQRCSARYGSEEIRHVEMQRRMVLPTLVASIDAFRKQGAKRFVVVFLSLMNCLELFNALVDNVGNDGGPEWNQISPRHGNLYMEAEDSTRISILSSGSASTRLRGITTDILFANINIGPSTWNNSISPMMHTQKMELVFFRELNQIEGFLLSSLATHGRALHVSQLAITANQETEERAVGFRASVYAALWAMQQVGIPYLPARLVVDHMKRTRKEGYWNHQRFKKRRN